MGRGPLDEEAIRTLELGNPDVEFDWTRILKGQPAPEPKGPERRDSERRERREPNRGRDRRAAAQSDVVVPGETEPPAAGPTVTSGEHTATGTAFRSADSDDVLEETEPEEERMAAPTPAQARLGSEGLARLRARYSEMLARIDERVAEPERQAELKSLAERLNPDGWVTDADVSAGLESYESTFAALRAAIPPRIKEGREPSV